MLVSKRVRSHAPVNVNISPFNAKVIRDNERLYNQGASILSDTELLAHILRDFPLAETLMTKFGNLQSQDYAALISPRCCLGIPERTHTHRKHWTS